MMQNFKMLPYHLKNAWRNIRRNLAMSISSATAVTVTLLLIMLFLVVAVNIDTISNKVEDSVEIFVQIDTIVEESEYETIEAQLKQIAHVKGVTFSSKEEQMKIFLESDLGGDEYASVFEDENPLSAAYFVEVDKGENIKSVAQKCRKIDGVLKAEYGGASAETMIDAFQSIRIGGSIFVVALCFLAIFLISNTIKITIQARRNEIAIMRNVGASNWFIKIPFMLEGVMISIAGAVIPILAVIFGYQFVYQAMDGMFFSSLFLLERPFPFVLLISFILLGLGIIVGLLGSWLSVNKYLKWKR